jgi:hypothetical protein
MRVIKVVSILIFISVVVIGQSSRKPMTRNPNSGYANFNEISGGYGLGSTTLPYSKYYFGLTTIHGYQLNIYGLKVNQSLFGGLGTGFLLYDEGLLVPVFADLRFIINKRKISSFAYCDAGFHANFEDPINGLRMFIDTGLGLKIKIRETLFSTFSIGAKMQVGNTNSDSFINSKLGLAFKPK